MSPPDSEDLQYQLAKLLAKSRRLRSQSSELNEEILRLTRLIAGLPAEPDAKDEAGPMADWRMATLDAPGSPLPPPPLCPARPSPMPDEAAGPSDAIRLGPLESRPIDPDPTTDGISQS